MKKEVHEMTDAEVLQRTKHGTYGPAIVGEELAARSKEILARTGGGRFGPGITDHPASTETPKAKAVKLTPRPAAPPPPPAAKDDDPPGDKPRIGSPNGPAEWSHVTLSGAKVLAQRNQVSYAPRVKRVELIDQLIAAAVVPPPVPDLTDEKDED